MMDITYTRGPRILEDGTNLDLDVVATFPEKDIELSIDAPVTGISGLGYQPGQKNRNGSEL